jgi:anthranilate phosphoribosyltransferase
MREQARPIRLSTDAIDTCGTGGDGARTFNVSTVAAFVAAGAGCRVAKHGNRAVSSRCGSADLLEALGIDITAGASVAAEQIDGLGVGFLYAQHYHGAARHAAGPRREIAIRSIFNIVGPLANPALVRRQLVGVFESRLTETVARALGRLGAVQALVVHGEDGLDEITLGGATRVTELRGGRISTYSIDPASFGLPACPSACLAGGSAADNAKVCREVLSGRPGPARDVVLLNAGAAIYVAGRAATIADGIARARESIDTGRALGKLEALRSWEGSSVA